MGRNDTTSLRICSIKGLALFAGLVLICLTPSGCDSSSNGADSGTGDGGKTDAAVDAGKDAGTGDGGGGDASSGKDAGDASVLVGAFQVQIVPPVEATSTTEEVPGYTSLVGKVYNGPTPSSVIWEKSSSSGSCILYKPRVPYCSTSCGSSAMCVEDDTCQAYPTAQDVGTITVKGILDDAGETEFTIKPISKTYQKTDLQYPSFSEGGDVSITVPGGSFTSEFSLASKGIAELKMLADTYAVNKDTALAIGWTAAGVSNVSKIHVKLDISHHGGTKGMIECDTTDTGSLSIASSLITELLNLGVAGYPTIVITRSATGSANITAGRVDLVVSSIVELPVTIQGVTSCTKDEDCPTGQTCQSDLTCK